MNFRFPNIKIFGKPKHIFNTDPYEQPDRELSVYFTECGDGVFCLTTFDNMNIHVYVFNFQRDPEHDDGLNLVLKYLVKHKLSLMISRLKVAKCQYPLLLCDVSYLFLG